MEIRKLTITPIVTGAKKIEFLNPTKENAQLFINERLSSARYDTKIPRIYRKLPKFLKGLVNPQTRVI